MIGTSPTGQYTFFYENENKNHGLGTGFILYRREPYQHVRFEVFTAVAMKNGVYWDVTPCGFCKNRRFGVTWRLLHQGDKNR
jgi:hypothetical protein